MFIVFNLTVLIVLLFMKYGMYTVQFLPVDVRYCIFLAERIRCLSRIGVATLPVNRMLD